MVFLLRLSLASDDGGECEMRLKLKGSEEMRIADLLEMGIGRTSSFACCDWFVVDFAQI
jgi:hypothetical protein